MRKRLGVAAELSPLTPITFNPEFPPGVEYDFLPKDWPTVIWTAKVFFSDGFFKDQKDITPSGVETPMTKFPLWKYFQVRHYLLHNKGKPIFSR